MISSIKAFQSINKVFNKQRLLVCKNVYMSCDDKYEKGWYFKYNKQDRKKIYTNPVPRIRPNYADTLILPGVEQKDYLELMRQFISNETNLSSQNVSLLWYNFSKNKLMTDEALVKLEEATYRHKGMYESRSVFGGLYGAISHHRTKIIDFFINEYQANNLKFLLFEAYQIIQALNANKFMTKQQKHSFWQKHFKPIFMEQLKMITPNDIKKVFRIFDNFHKFQYYDEVIWTRILSLCNKKRGEARVQVMERIYPLTGIFPRAKALFDKYYLKVQQEPEMLWRYNFEKVRYYSSEEMIAKSQNNIKLNPQFSTVLEQDPIGRNQKYEEWLIKGQVKGERQIIKDKTQSLAYAIHDRYFNMREDNIDLSKMSKKEFEQLFGFYDQKLLTAPAVQRSPQPLKTPQPPQPTNQPNKRVKSKNK